MSEHAIRQPPSRFGRWLAERRIRLVLWIAVAEGVIVALAHDVSRWTVIAIAIPSIAFYLWAGRSLRSDTGRQISWILAASQSLAVVVTILSFLIFWIALVIAGIFAAIALFFIFIDRPG